MTATAHATQSSIAAQTQPFNARTRRGTQADSAQNASEGAEAPAAVNAAGVANFAHLISLLRSPVSAVDARSAGGTGRGGGGAAKADTGGRDHQDTQNDPPSPIVAQATIDVAAIAAKELKTPSQKNELAQPADATQSANATTNSAKRVSKTEATPGSHDADGKPGNHGDAHEQQSHESATSTTNPGTNVNNTSTAKGGASSDPTHGAGSASPVQAVGNAHTARTAGAPSEQTAAASSRGAAAKTETAGTPVVSGARATANRNFLSKLTNAAAPARAQVQQKQVTDIASRALAVALKKGGGEVTMKLRPEGLGQLKVHLQVEDAKVWATLSPQTASARDLLQDSLPHLRAALEAQGLTVERMTVEALPGDAAGQFHAGGAPHKEPQDAAAPHVGAETPRNSVTPDGSGASPQDSSGPRSGPNDNKTGGAGITTRTDAIDDMTPDSPWGFATGAVTSGVMEWIG